MSGLIANSGHSCVSKVNNLGVTDCPFNWQNLHGHFMAPLTDELTQAEVDDIVTTLRARAHHNTKASRWHKSAKYELFEDQSEDANEVEVGNNGTKIITREGKSGYLAGYNEGGLEHQIDMRTYNHKVGQFGIVPFDINFVLGMKKKSNGNYAPLKMDEYYAEKAKFKTPNTGTLYNLRVRFADGEQLLSDFAAIKTETDLHDEIVAVEDVILNDVTNGLAAGVFDIVPKAHSINLCDTFGTVLNSTTVYKCKLKETGADLTITSVASTTVDGVAANKLTLSTGDTDYDAGETAVVYWNTVSALIGVNDDLIFETTNPNPAFTSGQLEIVLT